MSLVDAALGWFNHDPSLWYCLADTTDYEKDDATPTAIRGFVTTQGAVRALHLAAGIECEV